MFANHLSLNGEQHTHETYSAGKYYRSLPPLFQKIRVSEKKYLNEQGKKKSVMSKSLAEFDIA